MKISLIRLNVFLAAFLLFQIELMIAKVLLPDFGGSYLVWGACVVFFQAVLLAGYSYSHWIIQKVGIRRYPIIHIVMVLLPLLCFPGRPLSINYVENNLPLSLDVFWQLLKTIGPAFFVLSTFSVVWQVWLFSSKLPQRKDPYSLYAVSNLGSFGALLTYPFVFEPYLAMDMQLNLWRALYLVLVILQMLSFFAIKTSSDQSLLEKENEVDSSLDKFSLGRWFLLGAAGVMLFLSVTTIITNEIAPIPLLWTLPLCLYLLAFVLNFRKKPFCPSWIRDNIHVHIGFLVFLYFSTHQRILPISLELILLLGYMFILCMYCQNELYRSRPKGDHNLTLFYLVFSLGGVIGGIAVNWIIPLVSTSFIELLFGVLAVGLAMYMDQREEVMGWLSLRYIFYALVVFALWPIVFQEYNFWGMLLLIFLIKNIFEQFKYNQKGFLFCLAAIVCLTPTLESIWACNVFAFKKRNYYGNYKISERGGRRLLYHGTTLHGVQFTDPEKEAEPLSYFARTTPIGEVLSSDKFNFSRIGAIGLGIGTISTYLQERQTMDFFELDPEVYEIARDHFAFVNHAKGKLNFIFGDARLSLNKAPADLYDLIIVDAFTSDSIPFHLLTSESMMEYRRHLKKGGIILFHISNRYIELRKPLASTALEQGARVGYKTSDSTDLAFATAWMAVTWDRSQMKTLSKDLQWLEVKRRPGRFLRPWTDQYSSVLPYIKPQVLVGDLKAFRIFDW